MSYLPLALSFILMFLPILLVLFFFNDTATTEIYTLSLHDALPICPRTHAHSPWSSKHWQVAAPIGCDAPSNRGALRSEEHTSELQSRLHLVCRLLLEKKKITCHSGPPACSGHSAY